MRKHIILSIVLFVVAVLVGVPVFFLFYQKPSCFDGNKNGDEAGVDCGGSCQKLCVAESLPLLIKGDPRILAVALNTYEVAALVENPNASAAIPRARYSLKIYSAESLVPVKTIESLVYVPAGMTFAIFEGPFNLDAGVTPTRALLEWDQGSLVWQKEVAPLLTPTIGEKNLTRLDSSPRLEVTVINPTLETMKNIDLTALLYDAAGSIFAASKTFVDEIAPGASAQAILTWPKALTQSPLEIQVIPVVIPQNGFLK